MAQWLWTNLESPPAAEGRRVIHLRAGDYRPGRAEIERIEAWIEVAWPHALGDAAARKQALEQLRDVVEAEIRRLS